MLLSHNRQRSGHADNDLKIYQLRCAVTAVTLQRYAVDVERQPALQPVAIEQRLHIFFDPEIQASFLDYPTLMNGVKRLCSFTYPERSSSLCTCTGSA